MKYDYDGLLRDKTAAGSIRWRVRVEGFPNRKIRIPMGPGEPGFDNHYHAARAGEKIETVRPVLAKKGTLDKLCDDYIESMKVQVKAGNLSQLTLSSRTTGLRQACNALTQRGFRFGSLDADLPKKAFVEIRDSFKERTGAGATCLKALRAAYKWRQEAEELEHRSPVFDVKSKHRAKGGATPWSADDVEKFLTRHGPGTMARLWFALAYGTHGRIGDMHTLGPKNEAVRDGVRHLEWQPSKKGSAFVSLPIKRILAEELENHDQRDTYLVTEYGWAFASPGSLDNRVRKWIIEAGLCVDATDDDGNLIYTDKEKTKVKKLATRSQHGIRKGVAEYMAGSGATEYELMSSFGWTDARTARIYTEKFKRIGAAAAASARLANAQSGPRATKRGPHASKDANKNSGLLDGWQPVGESNPSFQVENLAS